MDTAHQLPFDPTLQPIAGRDIAASGGPRPLAVIGARESSEICFATVAWTMPVSHKPPMIAFALRAKARTFQLLEQTGRFSVSTPDVALEQAVNDCGNKTGNAVDKSALVGWMLLPQDDSSENPNDHLHINAGIKANGGSASAANPDALPALAGSLTVLGCQVESIRPAGDHMLVTGIIEHAWSRADTDDRGRIDATDALLCVQHDLFTTAR